jgi:NADH-quinone oxidoreductase subunit M
LSITALFTIAGVLRQRIGTSELESMGGLWSAMPRLGGWAMFFAAASLGLPGLGNFVGEFLVLAGAFSVNPILSSIAALGLITSVIYAVWLIYRVLQGRANPQRPVPDLDLRETGVLAALALGLLWLGFYPGPVIKTAAPTVKAIGQISMQMPLGEETARQVVITEEAKQ